MLSIGGVAVRRQGDDFVLSEPFYVEIKPTAPRVDPGAMKVCGLDLDKLRAEGEHLPDALDQVTAWVRAHLGSSGSRAIFVGHNAPFDWSFVNWAYHACDRKNPFGYKALDTKALAMGVLGIPWFESGKERLEVELSLPPQDAERVHRADYDAWYQAHILVGLLKRRPECADL
jgi:DNA polymerase III epsilon subunit-like protein